MRDTSRTKDVSLSFEVGDRVVRVLHDKVNKLRYGHSGPYRVSEVLPSGRYRLRDLENRGIQDEFDVSNLRPYYALEGEQLDDDEYVVDRIFDARERQGGREYRIKWRGYPYSETTWEPRGEVERRCADLVTEFETARDQRLAEKATHDERPVKHRHASAEEKFQRRDAERHATPEPVVPPMLPASDA